MNADTCRNLLQTPSSQERTSQAEEGGLQIYELGNYMQQPHQPHKIYQNKAMYTSMLTLPSNEVNKIANLMDILEY